MVVIMTNDEMYQWYRAHPIMCLIKHELSTRRRTIYKDENFQTPNIVPLLVNIDLPLNAIMKLMVEVGYGSTLIQSGDDYYLAIHPRSEKYIIKL